MNLLDKYYLSKGKSLTASVLKEWDAEFLFSSLFKQGKLGYVCDNCS